MSGAGAPASTPLLDRLAIREVLERYMRHNDDGDLDRILSLFDDDAVFQVVGRVVRGKGQIRAFFERAGFAPGRPAWWEPDRLLLQPRSSHISSNIVVDLVDADTANAESEFCVVSRTEEGRARISLVGRYRDRLRRGADGQWRITSRTGVSLARPGQADTDVEWQQALDRMDERERANLRL